MGLTYLSDDEQEALLRAAQVCAAFSLIGSVFICVCYFRFPRLRKLSFTLVLWLAIADIGADISYFMGNPVDSKATCVAQGLIQQFFQVAQILWTVAIAWVLHDVTVNLRMYHPHEQKSLMRRFHIAVWGSALLSMLLPLTTDSYGSTGSWCWIKANPRADVDVGTMWRYLVLYCPLWTAIMFNIVVYVRIVGVVRRFSTGIDGGAADGSTIGPSAEQQTRMTKFVKRLVWYPAVLIVSWTFATINRIQNAAHPDNPIFGLFLLHTSLVAFQGFLNAVVYGSTDAVSAAVAKGPIVGRIWKALGRDGGTGEAQLGGARSGLDPEDEEGPADLAMGNLRYGDGEDSLGGFGGEEHTSSAKLGEVEGGGARVTGSDTYAQNDTDDVEVYNASQQSRW